MNHDKNTKGLTEVQIKKYFSHLEEVEASGRETFHVYDWAGNYIDGPYMSWDAAEMSLCMLIDRLGGDYETDRQEYEIRVK